jgi:two-component system, OmpR family, sensor kinase
MKNPRESLALRVVIVGGLQVFALILVASLSVPVTHYFQDRASPLGIARAVTSVLDDSAAVQKQLDQLRRDHHFDLSLYDDAARLVASNVQPPLQLRPGRFDPLPFRSGDGPRRGRLPPPPGLLGPLLPSWLEDKGQAHEPPVLAIPLQAEAVPYTLVLRLPKYRMSFAPLLLTVLIGAVIVALGAFLTTRFITLPLERLSKVVGAFGAGQFASRSDLERQDEVGVLASTFNHMADRIQSTRETERELLSNVAHELRTPLSRIRVALEIAEESDGPLAKSALLGIREDLGELEVLLEDVLTASRLQSSADAAQWVLRFEALPLHSVVATLQTRFHGHHPERTLHVEGPRSDATIVADEILLRRAVSNLLENAHKYTPDVNLPIDLRVVVQGEQCSFEVRDGGIGIAATDQEKVFVPFYRTEQSRSKSTGGVGLGLTLAKRIAEAHGGSLELESILGVGTVVRLNLPVVSTAASPSQRIRLEAG